MSDTESVKPKEAELEGLTEEAVDDIPGRRFGWMPDLPDARDKRFYLPGDPADVLPEKVDLRQLCGPVLDQGSIGSCTAQALAQNHMFAQNKQAKETETLLDDADLFLPSRLFIYYNERVEIGTTASDSGATIRDGIKTLARDGACNEVLWPYSDKLRVFPSYLDKPSEICYEDARRNLIDKYQRIINLRELKTCLALGNPVVFGFSVYESFMQDTVTKTGIAPMPYGSERMLGGHAVLAVGYDDSTGNIIAMNSWGTGWGDRGFFYLPYGFMTEGLADDFWSILHTT